MTTFSASVVIIKESIWKASKFFVIGEKFVPDRNKKFMEQVRECLRYYHYAYTTEKSYVT